MLPYYRKFHTHHQPPEHFHGVRDISHKDVATESREGPVQTSYGTTSSVDKDWYETWAKVMKRFNYEGKDLGGTVQPTGIDPKTRTRSYAGSAYYSADISSRPNLTVVTEALVENAILQKGAEAIASGVKFTSKAGETFTITAKKEVIICAGVVKSPQLLELSGIGNKELLEAHDIDVVIDNPNVGENLQDHAVALVSFEVNDGVQTAEPMLRDPKIFESLMAKYQKDRSGPLGDSFNDTAQITIPEAFGPEGRRIFRKLFDSVVDTSATQSAADKLHDEVTLDLLSQPDSASAMVFASKTQFNIADSHKLGEWMSPKSPGNHFTLFSSLNHPFSRGSIHINSDSTTDKPTIDPRYLSNAMDLELLARHVQFLSVLLETPPFSHRFKESGRRIPAHAFPNGTMAPSLEEAKKLVRETLISNFHPVGTCAMGKRDEGGVVNERLIVHGTKNLRVVDASIFPMLPRGNPITSVYATAERAADLIKEDWSSK